MQERASLTGDGYETWVAGRDPDTGDPRPSGLIASATITLGVYSHLWPTAEDRTRAVTGDLMAAALSATDDAPQTTSR